MKIKLYLDESYSLKDINEFICNDEIEDVEKIFNDFFYGKNLKDKSLKEKLELCRVDLNKPSKEYLREMKIFLCCIQFENDNSIDEIFITQNITLMFNLIENCFLDYSLFVSEIFIFECSSFEDAYKQALDMKETNPRCYESHIFENN